MVMTNTYLPIHLDVQKSNTKTQTNQKNVTSNNEVASRRRSNSQSQVVSTPSTESSLKEKPNKRNQILYFVTLTPLNDTFVKKHLLVPYFPETRKLGRPAGSKVKPDITNGFFDSRVLSRSHAAMFIDLNSGQLMLKDLGSSNGTYVNEERIGTDPVEIKIGDIIYLGFNIQADTNHKQISAKVENINVMQNFYSPSAMPPSFSFKNLSMDTPEFKHYNFIQDLISKVPNSNKTTKTKEQHLTFENALFGDINPNIEDSLLGLSSNENCGIFNNAQVTNASSLDNAIKTLMINLSKIKQQNNALATLEEFVIDYQSRLNERNSNYLSRQFETKLKSVRDELTKEKNLTRETQEKHESYETEMTQLLDKLRKEVLNLNTEKSTLNEKIDQLSKARESELIANSTPVTRDISDGITNTVKSDCVAANGNSASNNLSNNKPTENEELGSKLNLLMQNSEETEKNEMSLHEKASQDVTEKKEPVIEENHSKLTPPSSDNELDPSRQILHAIEDSQDIESIKSVIDLNRGLEHKGESIPELLQVLPLKDKITLALYIALFALVLQSIERNRGVIFGLSVVLFVSVFQRFSNLN